MPSCVHIVSVVAAALVLSTQPLDRRLVAAPAPEPAPVTRDTAPADRAPADTASRLDVRRLEVAELALPVKNVASFRVPLVLGGTPATLDLTRHSLRASNFRVRVDAGGGRLRDVPAPAVSTYRGQVVGQPESVVAASLVNGAMTATVRLQDGDMWHVQARRAMDPSARPAEHLVYTSDDLLPLDLSCGTIDDGGDRIAPIFRAARSAGAASAAETVHLTEIAFDADFEFYERNNSSATDTVLDIEAVMNAVDAIYRSSFMIGHEITEVIVRTVEPDPYDATDPYTLLDQFRGHWNAAHADLPRDVAHLMTGKNLDGSIIGLAWVAEVCGDRGYGLSQSRFSANFARRTALTAHELGHNWSARHCNGDADCAIMCSFIAGCTGTLDAFGASASAEILAYRDFGASCVDVLNPPPPPCNQVKLLGSPGSAAAAFGSSTALEADVAVIGAPGYEQSDGAAHVQRLIEGSWHEEEILRGVDITAAARFGTSVDVDGDLVIVGAPLSADDAGIVTGSACIFRHDGTSWQHESTLRLDAGEVGDLFGWSVAIDGDVAIIGAPTFGTDAGTTFVFRRDETGWTQAAIVSASDGFVGDRFGASVAIDGDEFVVGAPASLPLPGAAYVYELVGVSNVVEHPLAGTLPVPPWGNLGQTVAISGNVVVSGATASSEGTVYVFRFEGGAWQFEERFDSNPNQFGASVAIDGDLFVVGAPKGGGVKDSTYVYRYDGAFWGQPQWLLPEESDEQTAFGHAVSVSNERVMVGAVDDDELADDAGAAYAIDVGNPAGADCNGNGRCDDLDIHERVSADVDENGVPDECQCRADLVRDGDIGFGDLAQLLASWGACDACPEDLDQSGSVGFFDLTTLLEDWGPCP